VTDTNLDRIWNEVRDVALLEVGRVHQGEVRQPDDRVHAKFSLSAGLRGSNGV
jgi:hypothetical protein